ncbi:MAG: stage III sporulation protein AF [Clostridiales bacterium]|nr:stage III sporulation protein AF [Clostridiales bacterium]
MNTLVELIKKIGIFMIAAQAVIHFAPDIKYAKYMKLIVGIMVLLQFLSPIYEIVNGMEADWGKRLADIEQELGIYGETAEFESTYSATETAAKSMEEEIKSKLNSAQAADFGGKTYTVTNVKLELVKDYENDEGAVQYNINKIRVIVWERTNGGSIDAATSNAGDAANTGNIGSVDKIQIDKVEKITSDIYENDEEYNSNEYMQINVMEDEITDILRERFCGVLGMEESYMEVIVYGAD